MRRIKKQHKTSLARMNNTLKLNRNSIYFSFTKGCSSNSDDDGRRLGSC